MTARNVRHPYSRLKAFREDAGLHLIRSAPVAPFPTDDLDLPVKTICNIHHRHLLLMNQNEALSSAPKANPDIQWGDAGAYRETL